VGWRGLETAGGSFGRRLLALLSVLLIRRHSSGKPLRTRAPPAAVADGAFPRCALSAKRVPDPLATVGHACGRQLPMAFSKCVTPRGVCRRHCSGPEWSTFKSVGGSELLIQPPSGGPRFFSCELRPGAGGSPGHAVAMPCACRDWPAWWSLPLFQDCS